MPPFSMKLDSISDKQNLLNGSTTISNGAYVHNSVKEYEAKAMQSTEQDPYEPILDANPSTAVVSSDYCACFCWTRPQLPPWMDMPISTPREDGSKTGNRLRGFTYAQLLYMLNLIACVVHLCFAIAVAIIAKSPVNVELWSPSAKFNVPQLQDVLRGNATAQVLWQPYYYLEEDSPIISLRDLTLWFFLLSAIAHGFVVLTGCQLSIYYWWIDQSRQTLRWVEYFWSSTLMMVALAIICGMRTTYLLLAIAALNMLMLTFGWVTEALSRPDFSSREMMGNGMQGRHTRWLISGKLEDRSTLILACVPIGCLPAVAALQRLGPFLFGWFPYVICWYILINVYQSSTAEGREQGNFPDFVDIIVYGEVALFSVFGIVMFLQQLTHRGCYNFYWGEVTYIALSLIAKILLGVVVATQVLIFDRFEDIFDISLNTTGVNLTGVTSWEELQSRIDASKVA